MKHCNNLPWNLKCYFGKFSSICLLNGKLNEMNVCHYIWYTWIQNLKPDSFCCVECWTYHKLMLTCQLCRNVRRTIFFYLSIYIFVYFMGNKDTNIFYTTASHSSVVHFVTELLWKYSLISSLFFCEQFISICLYFSFQA